MQKSIRTYGVHLLLFLLTVITTMMVGAEFRSPKIWFTWFLAMPEGVDRGEYALSIGEIWKGAAYSFSFLAFLTFHEFGHYFTALYHKVKSSLPYYIPIYLPLPVLNIGSFGAVIRLKQIPDSTRKYFDIGIAGPIAGFVISIFLLVYGFTHLPPMDPYLIEINPEYIELFEGKAPTEAQLRAYIAERQAPTYIIGTSLLFEWLKALVPSDPSNVPNHFELIHYPFLFVGYITLFFTALNLLPIGQLDGGHVIYGMFGRKAAGQVARVAVLILIIVGGTGVVDLRFLFEPSPEPLWSSLLGIFIYAGFVFFLLKRMFYGATPSQVAMFALMLVSAQALLKWSFPQWESNFIWMFYSFLVVGFIGVDHPPALREHRVNRPRQVLGWLAILIFIVSFSPAPIQVIGG